MQMNEEEIKKLYPNIEVKKTHDGKYYVIQLFTLVRKKHYGKWYYYPIIEQHYYEKLTCNIEIQCINNFHKVVYYSSTLVKIDLKNKNQFGQPYYTKDTNQESEIERIKKRFKILK